MKEVILNDNPNDIKCYIDDLPIKDLIPDELIKVFITALSRDVYEIVRTKQKRKAYYEKSKMQSGVPP